MEQSEDIQLSTHHIPNSVAWFLVRLLGLLLALDTAFAVLLLVTLLLPDSLYVSATIALWVIFTVKVVFAAVVIWRLTVAWGATQYYLQAGKLIRYHGFLERNEQFYPLDGLRMVQLNQGVLGRWLNYGDIELALSSPGLNEPVKMVGVFNPKKYERVLRGYLSTDQSVTP